MSAIELGTSLLDRTRPLETEALIELNDVFGPVDGPRILDDVDSAIESQVGNKGVFVDRQFNIDAWPDACLHLATHIVDVREHQTERLKQQLVVLGYNPYAPITPEVLEELGSIDSKIAARARSVGQNVIEVDINHANRSKEGQGKNGSTFYAGLTAGNIIFYSQKRYLLDLLRDGRIVELHRVHNSNNDGLWPDDHQFRSGEVANTRSIPESRELVEDLSVPEQEAPLEIAYIDKFGNSLLRARSADAYDGLLVPGQRLVLIVDGKPSEVVVGENLDKSETGQPTIFRNPKTKHPKYIEFAIKSEDCLSGRDHALEFLRRVVGSHVELRDLRKLALDLEAA